MITATQRRKRARYLCASDTPVLLGVSPYSKTPADIYWSKVSELPDAEETTESMSTGNRLEDVLIDWCASKLDVKVLRNQWRVAYAGKGKRLFAAHPDALIQDLDAGRPRQGIEAKYRNAAAAEKFGQEGTDQVPYDIIVQAQHQMYAAGLDCVWVPVALPLYTLEFRLYRVNRDEDLINLIVDYGLDWWHKHVKLQRPPAGGEVPPIEILKRMSREPESVTRLDEQGADAVKEWQDASAKARSAQDQADAAKARVLALLGESEAAQMPDGRMLTYLLQTSAPACDWAMLKAKYPDVYQELVRQGSHRVLRVKKAKGGQ